MLDYNTINTIELPFNQIVPKTLFFPFKLCLKFKAGGVYLTWKH